MTPQPFRFRLAYRPPFHWSALRDFFALRGASGVETVVDGVYGRCLRAGSHQGWITLEDEASSSSIMVRAAPDLFLVKAELQQGLRRMLDLDADIRAIESLLQADARLSPMLAQYPGLRVPGAWDGYEVAVRAIVGQQVSVKGATTVFSRLAEQFGEPLQTPITQLNRLPPLCERVAGASLESVIGCGMNRARAQALLDLSNAVARGWLRLQAGQEVAAVCKQLKSIRGIGDWTAQYIAMRVLRDADAFPASDLGLMKATGVQRPRDLLRIAEAWRPYRAYAAIHLWRSPGAGG